MDLLTAIRERHAVRSYLAKPIESDKISVLQSLISECNIEGGLHVQLVLNEPEAFDGFMAHYGNFRGVSNYIALIGANSDDLQEKIGYYGAKIMLFAQTLGLNTCWVAMSYKKVKTAFTVEKNEKLCSVLALGYGVTQGVQHKSKSFDDVSESQILPAPEWFKSGVNAALLAPTALNQQKFHFTLQSDGRVEASTKCGFYTKMDLGIAKYFFELGASVPVTWINK